MRARVALAVVLAGVTCACGRASDAKAPAWFHRSLPAETTVDGVRVVLRVDDFVPSPEDVRAVLAEARRIQPSARVERLVATRWHPGEGPLLLVGFAPHETSDRVRWIHTLSVWRRGAHDPSGQPTGPWQAEEHAHLSAEVCGPDRSFQAAGRVPDDEIVRIGVGSDVPHEVVLPILTAAKGQVPAGEVPSGLRRDGSGYELTTVHAEQARGLSGSTLGITREGNEWRATVTGRWVS